MSGFRVPLEDIDFVLNHVIDLPAVAKLNGFQHADAETVRGVLSEASRFFQEVIAPLNRVGDEQGSRLTAEGTVVTPEGFKAAYAKFVEAGWGGAHVPEMWGGGGLPYTVGVVIQEMFKAANMAFSLCPLLTQSAIEALKEHGSPEQQATYLENLVTGVWTGTMCLTEPHAGSDVGALSTRAVRQDDGSYRLFGQKIFITWGDHDLTENIIHLVLARTPGAPPGTKGISMFIVPKFLPDGSGRPGERNDVKVVSLEHKLGIHASPTCVLALGDDGDGAIGYLIGEEEAGMRYMFTMMNTARLGVGMEGLAIGERAYQKALSFARERKQSRALGQASPEPASIIEHPDVRRMLTSMKAHNEAMRALVYAAARAVDFQDHGETAEEREHNGELLALLTPILKAWCTDLGVEMASLGIQVHGGMGFVEETGAAQFYRDARIAPIYEGTNGIQAIDLVTRKLPIRGGDVAIELIGQMEATAASAPRELADLAAPLAEATAVLRQATRGLLASLSESPGDALAGASPYLKMFGTVLGGWFHLRSALAALELLDRDQGDRPFLESRIGLARFYNRQILPTAPALLDAVLAPESDLAASNLV
ncbi:MAG TPA: acyl-CoA dehydrogenase [Acidimicrobiia bacterium]|nr:acyl-CoA dehydrogenase [Acidimicrobiia bacterium]